MSSFKGPIVTVVAVLFGYLGIMQIDFGRAPRQMDMAPESLTRIEQKTVKKNEESFQNTDPQASPEKSEVSAEVASNYTRTTKHLLARKLNGRWVASGDILVDEGMLQAGYEEEDVAIARFDEVLTWPSHQIPFRIRVSKRTRRVRKAMAVMQRFTSLEFVPAENQSDYIVFVDADDEVCQSYLGRKGGKQEIRLHATCTTGQIMHEILHALGFVHEHSRADRDDYITIHFDNILVHRRNQFQKIDASLSLRGDFDFYSLLLYPPTAFSRNNRHTITRLNGEVYRSNREYLSRGDIAKIESIYGVFE